MSLGLQYKNQEHIFDEKTVDGVPFLSYPMLEETGIVHHGFSTKLGGVSKGCWATMNISTTRGDDPEDVEENQRRIARAIGVKPEDMTFTNQTHTTNVAVVRAEDKGRRFMETDGMITNVPGICLVTFYADCVPLYFVDPVKKVIGLSHSGWRGTVGKIGKGSSSDRPARLVSSSIRATTAPKPSATRATIHSPAARASSRASSGVFFRRTTPSTAAVMAPAATLTIRSISEAEQGLYHVEQAGDLLDHHHQDHHQGG